MALSRADLSVIQLMESSFSRTSNKHGLVHVGHACLRKEEPVVFAFGFNPPLTVVPARADDAVDPEIRDRLCGWKERSCPQAWSTMVIPGSAPRYSGIRACFSSVREAA